MENKKISAKETFETLMRRYPALECQRDTIYAAYELLRDTYKTGGKVMCCGNGGSCSDSDHIIGELMKSFVFKRRIDPVVYEKLSACGEIGADLIANLEGALPALSLCEHNALTTAFMNDTNPQMTFAQQLYGIGNTGDTLIAITTSGNSKNCIYACAVARAKGVRVIAMTGESGGKIAAYADVTIRVPAHETYQVQEYHLPVYHCLCAMLESDFFESAGSK